MMQEIQSKDCKLKNNTKASILGKSRVPELLDPNTLCLQPAIISKSFFFIIYAGQLKLLFMRGLCQKQIRKFAVITPEMNLITIRHKQHLFLTYF